MMAKIAVILAMYCVLVSGRPQGDVPPAGTPDASPAVVATGADAAPAVVPPTDAAQAAAADVIGAPGSINAGGSATSGTGTGDSSSSQVVVVTGDSTLAPPSTVLIGIVTQVVDTTTLPPATRTLGNWQQGAKYQQGDQVTYEGETYRCLQTHSADAFNWTPKLAQNLWVKVSA